MGLFSCWHEFDKPVDEDGFQYCKKCGRAVLPHNPNVEKDCSHIWIEYEKVRIGVNEEGVPKDILWVLKCTKCGELHNHRAMD